MKTVRILIKDGCVIDAKCDDDVDLVVYDLDTQDCDLADQIQADWDADTKDLKEIEIY